MQEATRIIAVRHGETTWNVDTRIQGQLDIPLNERGRWQASRAAAALANEAIDTIYTSDLQRAHATAQAIGQASGVEPVGLTGLRERGFGDFQGRTFAEIEATWPAEALAWRKRVPDWAPPGGGESLMQLRERVMTTLHALAAEHMGQQIVVVAHGGVLDVIHRAATGQDLLAPRTWDLGNATVNRLLWTPDGLTLVGWGDRSHLDEGTLDEQHD